MQRSNEATSAGLAPSTQHPAKPDANAGLVKPTQPTAHASCVVGAGSASDLRKTAVDGELAGSHETAVVRREEGRPRRDPHRFGHALERIQDRKSTRLTYSH